MKRLVLSVMLMLGLIASPTVTLAAQPAASDTSFQSALTGDVLDLGTSGEIVFSPDSYELSQGRTVSEEYIWFTYGWSNFEVVVVEGDIDAGDYYDLTMGNMFEFYETFEVIEENVGTDSAWFLANATYQGTGMVVMYDYQVDALGDFDLLVMQFGPADALPSDLEFVQQEVTFGDLPLLTNSDPQEVSELLGGGSTGTGEVEPTPESGSGTGTGITERMGRTGDPAGSNTATAEATETTGTTRATRSSRTTQSTATAEATEAAGTTRATRSSRTTATAEATEAAGTTRATRTSRTTQTTATEEATATATTSTGTRTTRTTGTTQTTATEAATEAAGGDWASMGLVSDTEWVSPNFNTTVAWDGTMWMFPTDYEYAIYINDDPVYDTITLETLDDYGYVFITVREPGECTPDSLADYYVSPEYADSFEQGVTIIEVSTTENTVSVVYETVNTRDQPLFTVLTATFMDDGTVIFTQISGAPTRIHEVYAQFEQGVQVNGVPLELNYTSDEVKVLAGN